MNPISDNEDNDLVKDMKKCYSMMFQTLDFSPFQIQEFFCMLRD